MLDCILLFDSHKNLMVLLSKKYDCLKIVNIWNNNIM